MHNNHLKVDKVKENEKIKRRYWINRGWTICIGVLEYKRCDTTNRGDRKQRARIERIWDRNWPWSYCKPQQW